MASRELKVLGKDASIAPSTLERGVEPIRVRRSRRYQAAPAMRHIKVHPLVWAFVQGHRYVFIESEYSVLILNRPAHEIEWVSR